MQATTAAVAFLKRPAHFENRSLWLSVGTAVRTEPRPPAGEGWESWMRDAGWWWWWWRDVPTGGKGDLLYYYSGIIKAAMSVPKHKAYLFSFLPQRHKQRESCCYKPRCRFPTVNWCMGPLALLKQKPDAPQHKALARCCGRKKKNTSAALEPKKCDTLHYWRIVQI